MNKLQELALVGIHIQREELDKLEKEIRGVGGPAAPAQRRKRRKMTPEQLQAHSVRMKKFWAAKRKAEKAG